MNETTVNIAGKDVRLAYCFATEIAFAKFTGRSVSAFLSETQNGAAPDPAGAAALILAAAQAATSQPGDVPTLTADDLLHAARPQEVARAFVAVTTLLGEWYAAPEGETDEAEAKEGDTGKN